MISQKIYIFVSFFCLSTLSMHAMHKLEHSINNLHGNNRSTLPKTQLIQQRKKAIQEKKDLRHMNEKDRTITLTKARKNKREFNHFTQ